MPDETPKIQVDSDWKAEAQAEKARLAEQEQKREAEAPPGGGRRGLPDPDFRAIVGTLASQAVMGLGAVADPQSGRVVIDFESAEFGISLLGVLQEKTKGNLTEEEDQELDQVLVELRARYVQVKQLVAESAIAPEGAGEGGPVIQPG